MKLRITIVKPSQEVQRVWFHAPAEVTIGRSQNCRCCIDDDAMISRMHAVLLADPPSLRVKDLNSTNGIIINGELYGGFGGEKLIQATELRDGDELMIGNTVLFVNLVEDDDQPDVVPEPETAIRPTAQPTMAMDVKNIRKTPQAGVTNLTSLAPSIPGYEVKHFVGAGRTGATYMAVNIATGESVAVKILFPDLAMSRKMADAFLTGFDEVRSISHPNVVKYLASGYVGANSPYLVMEYVGGPDMKSHLEGYPDRIMPLAEACGVIAQACSGLAYAHRNGLLHRDLRPTKILLDKHNGNQVKVADVAMTRMFDYAGLPVWGPGALGVNTLSYMPPEQLQELREMKQSADVFGIAAVFYEMLTGRCPYDFTRRANPTSSVTHGDIVPIEEIRSDLPEPLVVIIDRALLAEPDYRYQNCGELLEALENVVC